MRRFLDWLAHGGAEFSRLRVTTTARGGRGVVAAAAFAPGDVLLRVPEPLLLTVDKAARRPDVADALARARSSGTMSVRAGHWPRARLCGAVRGVSSRPDLDGSEVWLLQGYFCRM